MKRSCILLLLPSLIRSLEYDSKKHVVVQLPARIGAAEALQWCENGVASALPRVIDKLLSDRVPMTAVSLLIRKFEQHFDRVSGKMIIPAPMWAKMDCEHDSSGRFHAKAPPEWPFVSDPEVAHVTGNPAVSDYFCEILWSFGGKLKANDTLPDKTNLGEDWSGLHDFNNPADAKVEHLAYHLSQLMVSDLVPPSLIPPDVAPFLSLSKWNLETVVAVARVLPLFNRFVNFREPSPLKYRMSLFADTMCRFSDVEATVPGLHEVTPFTCSVIDMVLATLMCTGVAAVPRKDVECSQATIFSQKPPAFPSDTCYPPRMTLQRQSEEGKELRAFTFDDPTLFIPLLLEDLRPLPPFVPKQVRNSEILTYLTLFRASMLLYNTVDGILCVDELPPSYQLIPGWRVVQIIHVQAPRDPVFEVNPNSKQVPFAYISQSTRNNCHFNVAIRGTASRLEWLLDFNYWAAPLSAPDGSKGGMHQGYTDIVHTVGGYIRGALESLSEKHNCNCANTKIVVHGHSLGGGVGQLIALQLAMTYSEDYSCALNIDGVFFASPRVLVGAALDRYRQLVNGRHLIDLSDPLYYLPCHTENARLGFARCGTGHMGFPGTGRDEYGENDGRILLDVDFSRIGANLTVMHTHQSVDPPYVTDLEIHEMAELLKNAEARQNMARQAEEVAHVPNSKPHTHPDHDPERQELSPQIVIDSTLAASGFSSLTKRLISGAVNLMIPNNAVKLMPTKKELMAAHVASFGCALSVACHGLPWGQFRWWCDGLPEGIIDM